MMTAMMRTLKLWMATSLHCFLAPSFLVIPLWGSVNIPCHTLLHFGKWKNPFQILNTAQTFSQNILKRIKMLKEHLQDLIIYVNKKNKIKMKPRLDQCLHLVRWSIYTYLVHQSSRSLPQPTKLKDFPVYLYSLWNYTYQYRHSLFICCFLAV